MRGLVGSLLIHAGVIALLWFSPNTPPIPEEKIEIEIKETPEDQGSGNRAGKAPDARRSRSRGGVRLRDLKTKGDFGVAKFEANPLPFTHDNGASSTDIPPGASGPVARGAGWSPEDWGYGGGGTAYLHHTLDFRKLVAEVEQMLNYPDLLGKRGFDGTYNVRIFFKDQKCDWKKLRVKGPHPYLKVYVTALLKKLCSLEQIQAMHFPDGMTVDMSFAFIITDKPYARQKAYANGQITGNVLTFARTFPAGQLEYQIGPIRGLWFAPAISLDWPWVVEHWEEWVEGKDPLAAFKSRD